MRVASRLPVAALAGAMAVLTVATGCVEIDGADLGRVVERDEKHFTVSGRADVSLSTFDGSIEVRTWDRADVQVTIEKRAASKESLATIEVESEQNGDKVTVAVKSQRRQGFDFHFGDHRSAKLIVSVPVASDLTARSGDGAIDVAGVDGRVELGSGDGAISGRDLNGDVRAHTGDGSIRLENVKGALNVDTGDGRVIASGTFSALRARSGDGSVSIAAEPGSAVSSEWSITTGDGSVTLALPEDLNGELDAHTGDGRIHMQDLALSNVIGEIRKNAVRGRLGSGGSLVRVRTGDGSITLKRSGRLSAESER